MDMFSNMFTGSIEIDTDPANDDCGSSPASFLGVRVGTFARVMFDVGLGEEDCLDPGVDGDPALHFFRHFSHLVVCSNNQAVPLVYISRTG